MIIRMKNVKLIIKTGFCVAYDWRLLNHSLPPVYEHSDVICLAVDKKRRSWSGNSFDFDDKAFFELVKKYDKDSKIIVYEDDFYLPHFSARENCNRQRTLLADKMGEGGWHVQVDCDEYFVNFKGFTNFLMHMNSYPTGKEKPYNVQVFLYDLFKKLDDGYLYVVQEEARPFSAPFATTKPDYQRARQNGHFSRLSPFYVIHETWSRSEEELTFKLSNWGHAAEELKAADLRRSYINLWRAIDKYNYKYIRDFHFSVPQAWESLGYVSGRTIDELIRNFNPSFHISPLYLWAMNNRMIARFRSAFKKLTRVF